MRLMVFFTLYFSFFISHAPLLTYTPKSKKNKGKEQLFFHILENFNYFNYFNKKWTHTFCLEENMDIKY